jgi:hypothetical protein
MTKSFISHFLSFITNHKLKTQGGGRKKHSRKKRSIKKLTKKKRKMRTPSSLSIFPDKSPQLQKEGEVTKLTAFTTKNVSIRDENNREFNNIINDRLAYRRAPRGQDVQDFSDILYGPPVVQLSKKNYNKLKKGDKVYYDRGSVVLRGPFIFEGHRRGPELLFRVKDTVYNKEYKFSISVSNLKDEKLYMVIDKRKSQSRQTKKRSGRKSKRKTRSR